MPPCSVLSCLVLSCHCPDHCPAYLTVMAIGTADTHRGCLADFRVLVGATLLYFAAYSENYPQTYLIYRPSRKMSSASPFFPDYVMDPGHKRAFGIYSVLKCPRCHYAHLCEANPLTVYICTGQEV